MDHYEELAEVPTETFQLFPASTVTGNKMSEYYVWTLIYKTILEYFFQTQVFKPFTKYTRF